MPVLGFCHGYRMETNGPIADFAHDVQVVEEELSVDVPAELLPAILRTDELDVLGEHEFVGVAVLLISQRSKSQPTCRSC